MTYVAKRKSRCFVKYQVQDNTKETLTLTLGKSIFQMSCSYFNYWLSIISVSYFLLEYAQHVQKNSVGFLSKIAHQIRKCQREVLKKCSRVKTVIFGQEFVLSWCLFIASNVRSHSVALGSCEFNISFGFRLKKLNEYPYLTLLHSSLQSRTRLQLTFVRSSGWSIVLGIKFYR